MQCIKVPILLFVTQPLSSAETDPLFKFKEMKKGKNKMEILRLENCRVIFATITFLIDRLFGQRYSNWAT
jgi:hypothetical protein